MQSWMPLLNTALGGLLTVLGVFLAHRLGRDERTNESRRKEVLPVVGRLLSATDELWRLHASIVSTALTLKNLETRRVTGEHELQMQINATSEELSALQVRSNEAVHSARSAVAEIAIICPAVETAAHDLLAKANPPVQAVDFALIAELSTGNDAVQETRETFIEAVRAQLAECSRTAWLK